MSALTQQLFRIWKHGFDSDSNTDRDHCEEIGNVIAQFNDLNEKVEETDRLLQSIQEALNSGDGSYRP